MSKEQTPIEMAIEALQSCKGLMAEMYAEYDGKPSRHPLNFIDKAITALRAMPTQEIAEPVAEAMCGDHGGMQGCSCSSCGSPLGPAELTAYCNGCGIRIKWPMADGSEYMVTPPTKPDQPRVDELVEVVKEWERVDGHEYYDDPEIWNSLHPRIKAWFGQQ